MNKKDYNLGAKMGIKLSENIVKRNTNTMENLLSQASQLPGQFDDIKSIISELSSNLESVEIERLYGIIKTVSPQDLEFEEKIILLKLIHETASSYPPNENQQQFLRRLCRHLEININDTIYESYNNVDLSDVIDSIRVQKAMYQIVKEYLYLEAIAHDYGNKYDRIFDCFSKAVDNKTTEILINIKVSIFGIECLYEQYGDEISDPESTYSFRPTKVKISITREMLSFQIGNVFGRISNLNEPPIAYMTTTEFKTELQEGKIRHSQLVSYILDADDDTNFESTKFVYGLKNEDTGNYLIIFVSEGLFIQLQDHLAYVRYDEICGVDENREQLVISLTHGYSICGETLQNADENQIHLTKDDRNKRITRSIRKMIRGVMKAYDVHIPNTSYDVERIIKERIGKISKSAPTYSTDDTFSNEKVRKKLDNALAKYAVKVRKRDAIAFIDTSFFGNGGDGLLFSCDGIAFDYAFEKVFLKYDEIRDIVFDKKHKNLEFNGSFSERKDDRVPPLINDISYNLDELKECIEEIRCLI